MDEGTGMTMAQPSSVQREPSMEEILASIRRIIEDNETSRKDEKAVSQPVSHQPPVETEARLTGDEASQSAAEPLKQEHQALTEMAPDITESDEPVAAKPVDFINDIISIRPTVKPEVSAAPVEPEVEVPEAATIYELEPELDVRQEAVDEIADDRVNHAPIVSEQSERKVALAFSELSEAYQASRKKSLADAAEEMLRPMLREWLDENLPQLVEKLVREEIERIARGS